MAIFLQIMSYVIHGTLIMSGGDIKGGPWPRDVHESSKLRSGLPPPQLSGGPLLPLLLARGSLLLVRLPNQVRRGACLAASCPVPTPSVVHTTCQLEEPLHMAGPAVTRRHMVSTILIGYGEQCYDGIFRHDMKSILIESANMHEYVLVVID